GYSAGAGTVQLALTSYNNTTALGTVNLTPSGTFSNMVIIPSTITTGPATFTATCSNGTTFSSPVNISSAAVNAFSSNASPTLGSNNTISGTCLGSGNTNGGVSFALSRAGLVTPIATTSNLTDANGSFNSSVYYPTSYGSGPAWLQVTCPNGTVFSSQISLVDPASIPPTGGLTIPPDTTPIITPAPVG